MLFVGVTLWNLAVNSGLVANIENFVVELFALESFTINADQIFRIAAVGGLVLVLAGSGLTVLGAVLFNLISDVTGGVRLTVIERRRPARARAGPAGGFWWPPRLPMWNRRPNPRPAAQRTRAGNRKPAASVGRPWGYSSAG